MADAPTLGADPIPAAAKEAAKAIDADVFLFNGPVRRVRDLECIQGIHKHRKNKKALLLPVTFGGDPDAAYKIARYFQDRYETFTVLISGMCKSAGTLIAMGAHEIVFTPFGELGPLDIQLSKVDRFDQLESGLSIKDALDTLESRAKLSFYKITQDYMQANNGLISFATASKAAADFVTHLYAPIFSRIDPEEVGARSRSMRIAVEYGKRLAVKSQNVKSDTLRKIAETYSSHSFVIDQMEASLLFEHVRSADGKELALVEALGNLSRFQGASGIDFLFQPLHIHPDHHAAKGDDHAKAKRAGDPAPNGRDSARTNGSAHPPPKRTGRGKAQPVSRRATA